MDELARRRAKRAAQAFLHTLRDNAFVTVVLEDGVIKIYTKGADPQLLSEAVEALTDLGSA